MRTAPNQTPAQLRQLTQLSKRRPDPNVDYQLALDMNERGNFGGALQLINQALWAGPAPLSPVDLLITKQDL
ncbi:MAG: hypothetical protein R3C68_04825 [Myxococcota bacterium]